MRHMTRHRCSQTPVVIMTLLLLLRDVGVQNLQGFPVLATMCGEIIACETIQCIFHAILGGHVVSKQRWAGAVLGGCDPVSGCESETRAQVQLGLMGSQTSFFLQSGAKK